MHGRRVSRGPKLARAGRGRQRVSPPPGPGRPRRRPRAPRRQVPRAAPSDPPRTARRPPPGSRRAANHTRRSPRARFQRGRRGRQHTRRRSPPPARAEAAAAPPSTSRGSGNGGVRLPGAKSVPAREEAGETPPRAAGEEETKLPPDAAAGRGCGRRRSGASRRPSRSRRGGGYRSALRPIVSLSRGSRRSRAREPGSSPERHLLPLLWKRSPASQAARPGPRLRAAGPARLTGPRQAPPLRPRPPPSWRGPGARSQRHVRAAPAFPPPAGARVRAAGCGRRVPHSQQGAAPCAPPARGGRERGAAAGWRPWRRCAKTADLSWRRTDRSRDGWDQGRRQQSGGREHGFCGQVASCFLCGST